MNIQQPKLRPQVHLKDNFLALNYLSGEYEIHPDGDVELKDLYRFHQLLDGKHSVADICQAMPMWNPARVQEFVEQLDRNFWLEESTRSFGQLGLSGLEFIYQLEGLRAEWEDALVSKFDVLRGDAPLAERIFSGRSFEYYHITRMAFDMLSAPYAMGHGALRPQLFEIFREEYRHDLLLVQSLKALGHTEVQIRTSCPLPYTSGLYNALFKWATTDLQSFMAALFIFEGTEADEANFLERLEECQLPAAFKNPQKTHAKINMDGDHFYMSRELFAQIPFMAQNDVDRVLHNMKFLVHLNHAAQNAVVDYYGSDTALPLRTPQAVQNHTRLATNVALNDAEWSRWSAALLQSLMTALSRMPSFDNAAALSRIALKLEDSVSKFTQTTQERLSVDALELLNLESFRLASTRPLGFLATLAQTLTALELPTDIGLKSVVQELKQTLATITSTSDSQTERDLIINREILANLEKERQGEQR